MYYLKLYFNLISAILRSQMQYRVSFIMQFIAQFIVTFTDFIAIMFIFSKFSDIKGWTLWQVGLLYGMTSVSFAIAEMTARGFDLFSRMIRMGDFDRILLRPAGVFIQLMTADFDLRKLGRILQGFMVLVIAWKMLGLGLNPVKLVFLTAAVINGIIFYMAIIIAGATICFWSVESTELPNMFTYGGVEATSYPIAIYRQWFRNILIFIIPLAFVNYFPALYLLDMPDSLGFPYWIRFIFPLPSVIAMTLAVRFWNYGVKHYQSTGS
jgi:ABC-2 type transport system permease protein